MPFQYFHKKLSNLKNQNFISNSEFAWKCRSFGVLESRWPHAILIRKKMYSLQPDWFIEISENYFLLSLNWKHIDRVTVCNENGMQWKWKCYNRKASFKSANSAPSTGNTIQTFNCEWIAQSTQWIYLSAWLRFVCKLIKLSM